MLLFISWLLLFSVVIALVLLTIIQIKVLLERFWHSRSSHLQPSKSVQYVAHEHMFSQEEDIMLRKLVACISEQYFIFPHSRLEHMVGVKAAQSRHYFTDWAKIIGKTVSFVVVDKKMMSPVVALDLLEPGFTAGIQRVQKQAFTKKVLAQAGIPYFQLSYRVSLAELEELLSPFLKNFQR